MPFYVAFDSAHKPRGKLDENYTELRDYLISNDFICYNFLEIPITRQALSPYDILVFVCPDFAKISRQDMMEIEKWITEDGGGLLLLSHAGGDRGRNSNLSELSEFFGIAFENDQVLDEENNIGMENMAIITTFNPPHPITEGISSLCYRAGCSLSIIGSAYSIATSNESSEPFSCPLICVSEPGNGRVCAIGSYELFRDQTGGGFQHDEHPQLVSNIFKWLVSDYRHELRNKGRVNAPLSQAPAAAHGASHGTEQHYAPSYEASVDPGKVDIDFSIKISTKSELFELLKIFQNQINTIQDTISRLIEKTAASEDEIIELKSGMVQPAFVSQDVGSLEPKITPKKVSSAASDDIFNFSSDPLSQLPAKPPDLLKRAPKAKQIEENFISLDDIESFPDDDIIPDINDEPDPELQLEPEIEISDDKQVNTEELKAELEGLESKINSVNNLISFIEKKYESGKLDQKSYDKQKKKLESDLIKTNKRIEQIKKKLG